MKLDLRSLSLPIMGQLWRKASDLFWQHPILWLPVLVADLVAFGLSQLDQILRHEALLRFMERHSVMGGQPDYTNIGSIEGATIVIGSLKLCEIFLRICLYTAALLVTAALTRGLIQSCRPAWRSIAVSLEEKRWGILVLSAKVLLLCTLAVTICTGSVTLLIPRISHIPPLYGISSASPGVFIFSVAFLAGVAYIISPSAIKLLCSQDASPIQPDRFMPGRMLAVMAVVASSAVGSFTRTVEHAVFRNLTHPSSIAFRAIYACASLLSAVPYVLLFVALSLIASEETESTQEIVESA